MIFFKEHTTLRGVLIALFFLLGMVCQLTALFVNNKPNSGKSR